MMESDGYGSPWGTEPGKKGGETLHGKTYNHLMADVHYDKGMACIDCHTATDLHGDGHIRSKREEWVEIQCETCHGTAQSYSDLKTAAGHPMPNLKRAGNRVVLVSKIGGKELPVLQTKDIVAKGSAEARVAMGIPAHMQKMECYSCHVRWAPQCYGCHAQQDTTSISTDWINSGPTDDPSKGGNSEARSKTAFKWAETRSYLRWESPALGINSRGKVSPFIPACQSIFTANRAERHGNRAQQGLHHLRRAVRHID